MGWLGYFTHDGEEFINATRTETYAAKAPWFKPVYNNEALALMVNDNVPYSTPAVDLAPWYDPDHPESNDFWGAYPLDVQGIESSSRTAPVTEFTTDGGSPGMIRHATKGIVYNVALVGASEHAVEYGMRWLRRILLGHICSDRLADSTVLGAVTGYLSRAPELPITDPTQTLRTYHRFYRNSKVIDGPTLMRKIEYSGSCYGSSGGTTWLVQFTLVAADPYEYGAEQVMLQGYMDPAVTNPWSPDFPVPGVADTVWAAYTDVACGVDMWQPIYDPLCGEILTPPAPPVVPFCYDPPDAWNRRKITIPAENIPLWGDLVPMVTIYSATGLRSLRIRWYADPEGGFDPNDDPCDFLGDWLVSFIPVNSTITIDSVMRQVRVTTELGHIRRADNLVFQYDSTPINWPKLSCGYGYVMTLDLGSTEATPVVDVSFVPRAAA